MRRGFLLHLSEALKKEAKKKKEGANSTKGSREAVMFMFLDYPVSLEVLTVFRGHRRRICLDLKIKIPI